MSIMRDYHETFQSIDKMQLTDLLKIITIRDKLDNAQVFDSVENVFF